MKFEGLVVIVSLIFGSTFVVVFTNAQSLVPAIITFGDSTVDVGNNDYVATLFKADYPPYGRDFANHKPTGRFCNGKLATDITGTYYTSFLSFFFESGFIIVICKHCVNT